MSGAHNQHTMPGAVVQLASPIDALQKHFGGLSRRSLAEHLQLNLKYLLEVDSGYVENPVKLKARVAALGIDWERLTRPGAGVLE